MLDLIGSAIVPIGNGEDAQVLLVRQRGRTVDLNSAHDTIGVLGREVRVVPGGPVLLSTEGVHLGGSGGEGALSDAVGTRYFVRQIPAYYSALETYPSFTLLFNMRIPCQ